MIVALQKVQESEKEILRNLYALYLHDLSKFTMNITIGANGFLNTKICICFGKMTESRRIL
ncbi:hypothetical protein BACERE00198_02623 [Bacillus cereus]|jgi:hypothetical protein|nr:hypothetical protein BACERE00198_02623 [Bacillus cereus]